MKKVSFTLFVAAALTLSACSNSEKEGSGKKEEITSQTESAQDEAVEIVEWVKEPITITSQQTVLFENEKGSMSFVGSTIDVNGNQQLILKFTGELMHFDPALLEMNVVFKQGTSETINSLDISDYRQADNEKYVFFDAGGIQDDVLRIDVSLSEKVYGINGTPFIGTFMVEEGTESIEIPGVEKLMSITTPIVREGNFKTITIKGIEMLPSVENPLGNSVAIYGSIKFEGDFGGEPKFSYFVPGVALAENTDLGMENHQSTYYAGPEHAFYQVIEGVNAWGKNANDTLVFEIVGEKFVIDLQTGKEENEFPLGSMLKLNSADTYAYIEGFSSVGLNGIQDSTNTAFYNAKVVHQHYGYIDDVNATWTNTKFLDVTGSEKLTFKVGAVPTTNLTENTVHTLRIYDRRNIGTDLSNMSPEKASFELQIKPNQPVEEISLDVTGMEEIVIDIDSHIHNETREPVFIPIIFADMILE